jgi:hypothetical protein
LPLTVVWINVCVVPSPSTTVEVCVMTLAFARRYAEKINNILQRSGQKSLSVIYVTIFGRKMSREYFK